jgi:hypothetical protein
MSITSLEGRFWRKVQRGDGCWVWTGHKSTSGYGRFAYAETVGYAHRFSYEIHNGSIPPDLCVCHRCDNPSCVNPSHLFLGTRKENSADMAAKGRHGNGHGKRLSDESVRAIRKRHAAGESQTAIAKDYGVSRTVVSKIALRALYVRVEQR